MNYCGVPKNHVSFPQSFFQAFSTPQGPEISLLFDFIIYLRAESVTQRGKDVL